MNYTKKGIATIKYVYMITLTGFLFIFFLIFFNDLNFTLLNDKQLEQDLIMYNILHQCGYENNFGFYSSNEITKEHFMTCLEEFEENHHIRISFNILNEVYEVDSFLELITITPNSREFEKEKRFCSISSTRLCNTYIHSTLFLEEDDIIRNSYMYVEIIS